MGPSFDVVGLGLNAVDRIVTVRRYPPRGAKERVVAAHTLPGGQVSSAMVGARRLGLRARYVGSVGDDPEGALLVESLRAEDVDTSHVTVVPGAHTQSGPIVVEEESGERTVFWEHDERLRLPATSIDPEIIADARILHVDGFDTDAAVRAAGIAAANGGLVTSDLDSMYPGLEELLPLLDFVIVAEELAPLLAGGARDPETAVRVLADLHGTCAVVTLGARGALACAGDEVIASPALRPPRLEDTTGAGDAFRAGFIYGVARGLPLEETLRVANAVASLSCRAMGARAAMPAEEELRQFLAVASPLEA
jgi:sulfofructose kinase